MNLRYKKAAAALIALSLAAATPVFAADPPTITITSGPEEGSTSATSSVAFAFEALNASSTNCSLAGVGEEAEPYECGSPQSFTLPDGSYVFTVEAVAGTSSASTARTFSIDAEAAGTTTEDTDEDEPEEDSANTNDNGGRSGGGGFKRYNTPVVVTGATIAGEDSGSSQDVGGAGDLSDFPAYITPVAPAPVASSQATPRPARTVAAIPAAQAQVGGTLEEDQNIPTTTATSSMPSAIGTSTLGAAAAAAAGSAATVPTWVWFALAIVLLAALLYWAYRSSTEYETR